MKYLKEFNLFSNINIYPIQVPPSKVESIDLIVNYGPSTWFINDVEVSDKEKIKENFINGSEVGVRHEALHILQELNIPEIFENSKQLEIRSEWFDEIKNNNFSLDNIEHKREFIDYFSLDHEIMAYAFSFVLIQKKPESIINLNGGEETEETIYEENADKIYKSIGGEVNEKFEIYLEKYLSKF